MGGPSREIAYDPDQNPEEKRRLRKTYRALHDVNATANDFTTQELTDKVHKADKLFHEVKAPQEATLDSMMLVNLSNMGAVKARAMKSGTGSFDMDDFVAKLITFMGGRKGGEMLGNADDDAEDDYEDPSQPLRWDLIGKKALAKSRRVPVSDYMLGPLEIEQKKRNVGKRAKLEKNEADKTKPQELQEEDIARSENETTKNVVVIRQLLEQQGNVNLFKFVINPHDFAQSVENIFHLSFLIRDGECALDVEDGEPMIFMCEPPKDTDYADGLKKQQMILQFDMDTWKVFILFGVFLSQH
ncbi:uncharacterized protein STEHIDRAFT_69835 [Stereum hirsutum FP-91666 SS1]|uniref:Non-structural maintenance of chromosomes element 4 n=1 Tax=Stereum hirsutum (strain FP-91666) TaxID=721885 RepID=R7RWL4_STEHR|nr:uncharacterized protein STEHIDRAFT_69835 [Stereum hirsutum FP-91666 SS1]EIM79163.1 hypothetical protein STEHIDRAFT_69835 [Stereum hirsutum FP-91666 SS1]